MVSKKGFEVLHPSSTSQKKQYFSQWTMTEKEGNYPYLFIAQFHWALSVLLIHALSITYRMLLQFTFQTTCTIWKKNGRHLLHCSWQKKNILVFKTSAILIIITIFVFQRLQLYMLFHLLSPCTSTLHILSSMRDLSEDPKYMLRTSLLYYINDLVWGKPWVIWMVRIGAWSAISNFPKDNYNCANLFIHPSKDDNFNIGFIFLFIGNASYSTCTLLSQEYCKHIGCYWKIVSSQLWT